MAGTQWRLTGEYLESCNCEFLCPCPESHRTARPTTDTGECIAALVFQIDEGRYGELDLDGLAFVVALKTPGPMADGDWTLGVIIDEQANPEQRAALSAIASGEAGGPLGRIALLVKAFAGIEYLPIDCEISGMRRAAVVPGWLDQVIEGVPGGADPDQPIYLDNVGHPANRRLALAKATQSHLHAFGIDWDDTSGRNNGHFAPFDWQGP